MFAVLKCWKMFFASLIFFALICCPLTALYASGPKMLYKIMLKKYQSLWKCPIGLHLVFLCVCVNLKQTSWRHSPPPISLNPPSKFSLYHVMYLSRGSISRGPPSPHFFKPNKNAGFKSRLCLKRLPHIFAMRYIVGFNFKNWVTKNYVNVVFKIII